MIWLKTCLAQSSSSCPCQVKGSSVSSPMHSLVDFWEEGKPIDYYSVKAWLIPLTVMCSWLIQAYIPCKTHESKEFPIKKN